MTEQNQTTAEGGDDVSSRVQEILEQQIRPAIMSHGGDIAFQGFEDGVVYVTLRGACAGCPGAAATLKMGVENTLRNLVPEVREVRQKR